MENEKYYQVYYHFSFLDKKTKKIETIEVWEEEWEKNIEEVREDKDGNWMHAKELVADALVEERFPWVKQYIGPHLDYSKEFINLSNEFEKDLEYLPEKTIQTITEIE